MPYVLTRLNGYRSGNHRLAIILLVLLLAYLPSREAKSARPVEELGTQGSKGGPFKCSQSLEVQDPLIREAVENEYLVRRVEFYGNELTSDTVLRRRMVLEEGDVFTREDLIKSLVRVSTLKKIIYAVKLSDVIIRLDRPYKCIDMTICFKERRR